MGADPRGRGGLCGKQPMDPAVKIAVTCAGICVLAVLFLAGGGSDAKSAVAVVLPAAVGGGGRRAAGSRERELAALVEQDFIRYLEGLEVPTLVSPPRRTMSLQLATHALIQDVPGDFVETGVYKGGMSILLLKIMEHLDKRGRRFWACDSFQGLPALVAADKLQKEDGTKDEFNWQGEFAAGVDTFVENMKAFDVYDPQRLQIVKGWFNESLPVAKREIKQISFLRLDGDLYVSTKDALDNLYPLMAPCGIVYIDDYGSFVGCKKAVDEYRLAHDITAQIHRQAIPEPWGNGAREGAWWMVPCPADQK